MINDDKTVSTQKELKSSFTYMRVRNDLNLSYEDNGFSFQQQKI